VPDLFVTGKIKLHLAFLALGLLKAEEIAVKGSKCIHKALAKACTNAVDIP
jgi:hypothetical protein